jgi:hydroxymethylpyrimidine pyrophosphatase-like HAD family hydrolase
VPELGDEDFLEAVRGMGLNDVAYSVGWSAWLDIAPHGVNKGTALERVRAQLGIPRENVLVVGDGRNDIEMFQWAVAGGGRAVAMGQAPQEVFDAANEATASVEEDGMAFVLSTVE